MCDKVFWFFQSQVLIYWRRQISQIWPTYSAIGSSHMPKTHGHDLPFICAIILLGIFPILVRLYKRYIRLCEITVLGHLVESWPIFPGTPSEPRAAGVFVDPPSCTKMSRGGGLFLHLLCSELCRPNCLTSDIFFL